MTQDFGDTNLLLNNEKTEGQSEQGKKRRKKNSSGNEKVIKELKVGNEQLKQMASELAIENAALKKSIISYVDESKKKNRQFLILKKQNENYLSSVKQMTMELNRTKLELQREKGKADLLVIAMSKELVEEERLVRSQGQLQRNYDRLSYRYRSLADSPLGKLTFIMWDLYNKIAKDAVGKKGD